MMAVWGTAGALLLVMLTAASYSYPVKQGFDPSSSYSGSYGANPVSADWEVPSSGRFTPAASGSGAGSKTVRNPARPQTAPRREPSYPQPSVQQEPVASYSSNSFAAPVRSGYASSSSGVPSFQPASTQDITWAVAPPSLFSSEETSTRPSTRRLASSRPAPDSLGPSNVSPPGPEFQAGELSQMENSYEHGNYESETEEQGFQSPPPGVKVLDGQDSSEFEPSGPGRIWVEYPYDYMFLTGGYPEGTITHSSSSFEQGRDHWQDTHYIKYYFPANPSTQEVETFPAVFEPPQRIKQPSQPVKQSIGSTSYGPSGAVTGQNQPYGVGPGYYSQPGRFEQPHQGSPAGGYGRTKVGY